VKRFICFQYYPSLCYREVQQLKQMLGMNLGVRQVVKTAQSEPAKPLTRYTTNAVSGEVSQWPEETTSTSPLHSGSPSSGKAIQSSSPLPAREQSGHWHHQATRYLYLFLTIWNPDNM
jgi:hypothetical protein